jgi:hypothetical protein
MGAYRLLVVRRLYSTGFYFSFPFLRSSDAPWSTHPVTRPPPTPIPTPSSTSSSDPVLSETPTSTAPVDGGLRLHNLDDRFLFYLPDPTAVFLCLPYFVRFVVLRAKRASVGSNSRADLSALFSRSSLRSFPSPSLRSKLDSPLSTSQILLNYPDL